MNAARSSRFHDLSEPAYVLFQKLRARMFAWPPLRPYALGTRPFRKNHRAAC